MTSTVEDLEKYGGENMKMIWDESSYEEIKKGNRNTTSGVLRLFIPADYGFVGSDDKGDSEYGVSFVDEWGYSNREAARAFIERESSRKVGGASISYRRKYPLDESDMWLMEDSGCKFSLPRLYQQRKYNEENNIASTIRRGNLTWKNGRRFDGVIFDDDPNGRFEITYVPRPEHQCKYKIVNQQKRPALDFFRLSIDPTDARKPTSGKGSRNAAYIWAKPSVLGFKRKTPVAQYTFRHESPNDFYEDMLLLAAFYSAPVLPEANKSGIINYFEDKGALFFIMNDPTEKDARKKSQKFGMHSSGDEVRSGLIGGMQAYIVESVGYLSGEDTFGDFPFDELIQDCIDFAPTAQDARWTKWDCAVAGMFGVAACDAEFRVIDDQEYNINLGDIMSTYKLR